MEREKATSRMGLRLTETLKNRIDERAAEEGRTPSSFVINVVTEYLNRIDDAKKLLRVDEKE